MTYTVTEVFYSLQGEGDRVGTANVFLRFAGCNLQCSEDDAGFNCDTYFATGDKLSAEEVVERCLQATTFGYGNLICTGGEPLLQLDEELLRRLSKRFLVCLETNGTKPLPEPVYLFSYVACSPKRGQPIAIDPHVVDEVRVVCHPGRPVLWPTLETWLEGFKGKRFLSPAWGAPGVVPQGHTGDGYGLASSALQEAIAYCKQNPEWRLSTQAHKMWRVR